MAHAVGLDALASAEAIADDLGQAVKGLADRLQHEMQTWPLATYREALKTLPEALQTTLDAAWAYPKPILHAATAISISRDFEAAGC